MFSDLLFSLGPQYVTEEPNRKKKNPNQPTTDAEPKTTK